jgi:ABC-type multidrug transport system ATPase subunit
LLGHNGAGKSTTIKMLTGMIKPSSGNAYVLGKSVIDDRKYTTKLIGFCPQHSILYDCLTAKEHMTFYGHLKETNKSVGYNIFFKTIRKMF